MKLFRDFFFSIGRQIITILAAILVLFIIFVFINQNILSSFSRTYNRQITLFESVQDLKNLLVHSSSTINEYLKTGDRTKLAEYNHVTQSAAVLISSLYTKVSNDDSTYLLHSIDTAYKNYFSECCTASFLFNSGNYDYYGRMYYAETIQTYLRRYCDELLGLLLDQSAETSRKIRQQQVLLQIYNWIFMLILFASFAGFLLFVSKKLTKPLNQLVLFSRSVSEGDFSKTIPVYDATNSVGVLIRAFNTMVADLKQMMESMQEKVKTEQKLLREQRKNLEYKDLLNRATFLALQTQTNPHFLFNTLNSISRTITLGKTDQSIEMLDSLAKLLRYSLSDATVPVPLSSELEITGEYMHIQKLRFGSRIQYQTQIAAGLENKIQLPRFTLQPLVENAIIHGIEPSESGGKVIITAKQRGQYGIIRIFDNGLGIASETLRQLQDKSYTPTNNRLGVLNTRRRLELQEKSVKKTFSILSIAGKWTMIVIRLKIRKKDV